MTGVSENRRSLDPAVIGEALSPHGASRLGFLASLASLRLAGGTGYAHPGLALEFGEGPVHEALYDLHRQRFTEWVSTSLEAQELDLEKYLGSSATVPPVDRLTVGAVFPRHPK
jgi:hypothetical protein